MKLVITVDGIECPKEVLAQRYEDHLAKGGLSAIASWGMAKDFLNFLEGYEK